MSILNLSLLVFSSFYIYSNFIISNQNHNVNFIVVLFITYSILLLTSLYYVSDLYYFYLLYELLNISIYLILIQFSVNPLNFSFLTYYYFIGFVGSLLFISSFYGITGTPVNYLIINISILLNLGVYPFSDSIANIYKNSSFKSYLVLSYYISYLYIIILFYINSLYNNSFNDLQPFLQVSLLLSICTLGSCYYNFNNQYELNGAVSYSSISNTPLLICSFVLICGQCFYESIANCALLLTFVGFYITVYLNNVLIINIYSYLLEPINGNNWLNNNLYFNSLSYVLSDFNVNNNSFCALMLLVGLGFPPTILFILNFQIFYLFTLIGNLVFVTAVMILLNITITYCYLRIINNVLSHITN